METIIEKRVNEFLEYLATLNETQRNAAIDDFLNNIESQFNDIDFLKGICFVLFLSLISKNQEINIKNKLISNLE